MPRSRAALLIPGALLLLAATAQAEPLTGRVTDADGRPVPNATVGDFLKGGPFARTDANGRYRIDIPGESRVVGAHKAGFTISGPRWIDARTRAKTADFTLFPAGRDVLKGIAPTFSDEKGHSLAMADSRGSGPSLWETGQGVSVSSAAPARITWTLNGATLYGVEVRWRTAPAKWHLEMTLDVTDGNGHDPHPETRTYWRNGEDPAHDNGNGYPEGHGDVRTVVPMAKITGVKSLALVIEEAAPGSEVALYGVSAVGPRPVAMADAVHAMRIGAGLQDAPTDPNALFRWNAWNGEDAQDPFIDTKDAATLIRDMGREVHPMRVLTINYEPVYPGGKLLREITGWRDPHGNTDEHIKDMQLSSHGYLRAMRLPEIEAREFPVLFNRKDPTQKMQFTEDSFLHAFRYGQWPSSDWGCDYNDIIRRYDLVRRVDTGDVDEVFIQGFPGLSMWETTMAGPNAYWCNSEPVPSPADSVNGTNGTRLFVMTAFNYEREADVMIHDWGHRTESIIGYKVYGGWDAAQPPKTTWDRFALVDKWHPGKSGVGFCHYPPNADKDYDYANPRLVSSDADDWLNYPHLTGARKMVNRDTWGLPRALPTGQPDYQRNYLIWFFSRIPHVPGIAPDGRQANWWKYIADFNDYVESR